MSLTRLWLLTAASSSFLAQNCIGQNDAANAPSIAIVGAGIGGTAAALHLRAAFGNMSELTVFESGQVGGRLATVEMSGYEYEAGGSVIHPLNLEMKALVKELGLSKRDDGSRGGDRFAIRAGHKILFQSSDWSILTTLKLVWHYGFFTLMNMKTFIADMLDNFSEVYNFLSMGKGASDVAALLDLMQRNGNGKSSSILNQTSRSLRSTLLKHGMTEALVDELATVAVRVNYGQMPNGVHGFVGSVALAGAQDGLWAVRGGNKLVPEGCLRKSGANLVRARVTKIKRSEKDRKYEIEYVPTPDRPGWQHDGESNGGLHESRPSMDLAGERASFDIVIVATPLTRDKTDIQFENLPSYANLSRATDSQLRFQRCVATFVSGTPNPAYFGADDAESVPPNNFYVREDDIVKAVGHQVSVGGVSDSVAISELPPVWKIFSEEKVSEARLDQMFHNRSQVKVLDWLAYPKYSPNERPNLGSFVLSPQLYHVNAVELSASAMEMSAIAAKNVANLAHADWTGTLANSERNERGDRDEL